MVAVAMAITVILSCSRICTSCTSFPTVSHPRPVPCIRTRRTTKPSSNIKHLRTGKAQISNICGPLRLLSSFHKQTKSFKAGVRSPLHGSQTIQPANFWLQRYGNH
uniref:Putative secreted peptide n=1 Tax=Anopheles braziliensis TaxID=58242 RepID=A0A2M3ZVL5_9DIPT